MTAARLAAAIAALLLCAGASAAEPAASDERARGWFTDTVLADQDGRPVRFWSDVLEDRTVVIGFVFTRCQGACPLIMEKLGAARRLLAASGAPVRYLAITVDPEHDTPAKLKAFAATHQAQGPDWTLLTGKPAEVRQVLKRLGAAVDDPMEHSTALIAGNTRSRHWTRIRPDAGPQAVARILEDLAAEPPRVAAAPRPAP